MTLTTNNEDVDSLPRGRGHGSAAAAQALQEQGVRLPNAVAELTTVSSTIPERRELAWPESAVFTLDRWLRRLQDVYEYSAHPLCLFRAQCVQADCAFEFADGTRIHPESRILRLHLWNEQVPVMGRRGPTLAWARRFSRGIYISLLELARYLSQQPELGDIAAMCVDARVSGTKHAEQYRRVLVRYGFETDTSEFDPRGVLHRFGDALFIIMLLAVTNPLGLQRAPFRYSNRRILLSRAVLEKRYATARTAARVELAPLDLPPAWASKWCNEIQSRRAD